MQGYFRQLARPEGGCLSSDNIRLVWLTAHISATRFRQSCRFLANLLAPPKGATHDR